MIADPCNYIPFYSCPKFYSKSKHIQMNRSKHEISKLLKLKVDSLVNKSLDEKDFLGVSVGIYKTGIGGFVHHAGIKNKLSLEEINDHTLFRIASITKPMTAAAILDLQKKSDYALTDPINDHLDYLTIDPRITIQHLLNHTSGLPHYTSNIKSLNFRQYNSLISASKNIEDIKLISEPGEAYYYSAYGYLLLGALIEKKSNLSYTEYMQINLWNDLGMNHTGTAPSQSMTEVKPYLKYKNSFIRSIKDNLSNKLSGGGVLSTSYDMLKFSKSILNGESLDSLTINKIFNDRDRHGNSDYVNGWHTDSTEAGKVLYHGGALSGTSSYIRIYLDQNLAITCLSNSSFSNEEVRYLTKNISQLFLDDNGVEININAINNRPNHIENWW